MCGIRELPTLYKIGFIEKTIHAFGLSEQWFTSYVVKPACGKSTMDKTVPEARKKWPEM